ncbi:MULTISPECIES: TetR family transcriptional regulator [Gordonia]|uniref:TetR family transcriptional regulator n=1 Tax=Gordonia alkanivorans CGMCC 6845 TaxID=1423140 RepID=W9DJK5_9ACTN|nr:MULTISPECIES: TetR family transcriptional regulator [Gordonia]ETA06610.1 TetR family transcriptional regulator [Gordonia alkanivorans CGMCC 6845]MDH3011707.1 TetR family transcriptional regulator [Gordonia alkanivorans]QGP87885.1 TetR family transcriptional regulator [Gordonia sp. 135]
MTTRNHTQDGKSPLRDSLLDGLHDLLTDRDWSAVRMSDVAAATGVSRQTVYNEFGSRYGLAQGYAVRLANRFAGHVADSLADHVDDVTGALRTAFTEYFAGVATDPLIASLLSGEAKPDLMKLITTDVAPIITTASDRLAQAFRESTWLSMPDPDVERVARAITRMALSYVAMPPEGDRDVATDLAEIISPAIEAARIRR